MLIGLHLRVIIRIRNKGETEAYFLDSVLFLGGSRSGTLELYEMVEQFMPLMYPKDHESDLRNNY
jgi:hypothetical protein